MTTFFSLIFFTYFISMLLVIFFPLSRKLTSSKSEFPWRNHPQRELTSLLSFRDLLGPYWVLPTTRVSTLLEPSWVLPTTRVSTLIAFYILY